MIDMRAVLTRLAGRREEKPTLSREELVERGAAAERILGSALWQEAWSMLAEQILDRWQRSRPDDTASRELCYAHLSAAASARAWLEAAIKTGAVARHEIEAEARRQERAARRRREAGAALGPRLRG
jgi:hypothetical protein